MRTIARNDAGWTPAADGDGESGAHVGFDARGGASNESELLVSARGQTDLVSPLVDALEWEPDTILIISDGFENAPPGLASQVVALYERDLRGRRPLEIVHLNPVFHAEDLAPRALGNPIPTLGLRDAEDILTMLGFARFASGRAPVGELEAYLQQRERTLIEKTGAAR